MHELEDGHEYEFVEGTIDSPMSEGEHSFLRQGLASRRNPSFLHRPHAHDSGIESLASRDHRFYSLWNPNEPHTLVGALAQLDTYVADEGPFDGVLGFSAGCTLAGIYLAQKQQQGQQPFRCAVFLSSGPVSTEMERLGLHQGQDRRLRIPTAHIWGSADEVAPAGGRELFEFCEAGPKRQVLVHDGGHEMPRKDYLTKSVHVIRKVISHAV